MAYGGTVDVKNFSRWVVGNTKATHIIKSKRLKKLKFKSCAISQVDNGYNLNTLVRIFFFPPEIFPLVTDK